MENKLDKRLDNYSELFDLYIESGRLPEDRKDDPLSEYLGNQVEKYRDRLGDEDFRELLRESLLGYCRAVLPGYMKIQESYSKEKSKMEKFFASGRGKRQDQLEETLNWLSIQLPKEMFNAKGYQKMIDQGEMPLEDILEAMRLDWGKAANEKMRQELANVLKQSVGKEDLSQVVIGIGKEDYEEKKKTSKIFWSYPQLPEILRMIGREHETDNVEKDNSVTRDIPILLKHAHTRQEIDGVTIGDELSGLLPLEYALMNEPVFYKKFVNKELQQFSGKPPVKMVRKTELLKRATPRLEKGPIILAIDTSGSMDGKPIQIAKALLDQSVLLARKQKRKCFLITFSVRAKCLDISRPSQYGKVEEFFAERFTGGTDGEEMFSAALQALEKDDYAMADVLIISDFYINELRSDTQEKIKGEQSKGTRFYGLSIGGEVGYYKQFLNKYWTI